MDKIDITPKTEEEFLTMVEMHNLYHSHEPEQVNNSHRKRCRVCHMLLEEGRKGLETISRKGNTSVYDDATDMSGFGIGVKQYSPLWMLTWFLKAREFNMVDALLRYRWQDTLSGCDKDEIRERFSRWFNPVYAMRNGVKSQQYARAGFIYAQRIKADDDTRKFASTDPEWAYQYAISIDKKVAHNVTRDGACRYMETAKLYAGEVDKGYHPTTLTKVLETEKDSFEYLGQHYAGGIHKDMNAIIKARWVREAKTALKYAGIVGPEDDTRAMVLLSKDARAIYDYASMIDKGARDDTRQALIEIGEGSWIFRYADKVDGKGRDDTRAAALSSPGSAVSYARVIDKGPRDDTRTAACKDHSAALEYAQRVDGKPCDETRIAASKHPVSAYMYALDVDHCAHDVTRIGACQSGSTALSYAIEVDQATHDFTRWAASDTAGRAAAYARRLGEPHDATRAVACMDPRLALEYAMNVDEKPRNDTRQAAAVNEDCRAAYTKWEAEYYKGFIGELFTGLQGIERVEAVSAVEVPEESKEVPF